MSSPLNLDTDQQTEKDELDEFVRAASLRKRSLVRAWVSLAGVVVCGAIGITLFRPLIALGGILMMVNGDAMRQATRSGWRAPTASLHIFGPRLIGFDQTIQAFSTIVAGALITLFGVVVSVLEYAR